MRADDDEEIDDLIDEYTLRRWDRISAADFLRSREFDPASLSSDTQEELLHLDIEAKRKSDASYWPSAKEFSSHFDNQTIRAVLTRIHTSKEVRLASPQLVDCVQMECPNCQSSSEVPLANDGCNDIRCPTCRFQFSSTRLGQRSIRKPNGTLVELHNQLGTGATGAVWKGFDPDLDMDVAVKMPYLATDPDKIRREAKRLAKLEHAHIARVFGVVEQDGNLPCILSKYKNGISLEEWLKTNRPSEYQTSHWGRIIADAIAHSHSRRLTHGDIKPGNIILERNSDGELEPHMIDFGASDEHTLHYASPEQIRRSEGETSIDVDERTDIYSVGAVLNELLTGGPPFSSESRSVIRDEIKNELPVPPRARNREVSRDMSMIVMKCLQKNREDRYQTAQELRDDLLRLQKGVETVANPDGIPRRTLRWLHRNPVPSVSAGIVITVLSCFVVLLQRNTERAEREAVVLQEMAEREAVVLQETTDFFESMLKPAESISVAGVRFGGGNQDSSNRPASDLLLKSYDSIQEEVQDPRVKSMLYASTGEILTSWGKYGGPNDKSANAVAAFQYAIANYAIAYGVDSLRRQVEIWDARSNKLDDESIGLFQEFQDTLVDGHSGRTPEMVDLCHNLAFSLHGSGDYARSEENYRRAIMLAESVFGNDHVKTIRSTGWLSLLLTEVGKMQEAEKRAESMVAACQARSELGKYRVMAELVLCAVNLQKDFVLASAAEKNVESIEKLADLALESSNLGENHQGSLYAKMAMDFVAAKVKLYEWRRLPAETRKKELIEDSLGLFRNSVDIARSVLGKTHPFALHTVHGYCDCLIEAGQSGEARRQFETLLAAATKQLKSDHPRWESIYFLEAELHYWAGDKEACIKSLRKQVALLQKITPNLPMKGDSLALAESQLADILFEAGESEEARSILERLWKEDTPRPAKGRPPSLWQFITASRLARARAFDGDLKSALVPIDLMLRIDIPADRVIHFSRYKAELHLANKQVSEAVATLRRAQTWADNHDDGTLGTSFRRAMTIVRYLLDICSGKSVKKPDIGLWLDPLLTHEKLVEDIQLVTGPMPHESRDER